MPVHKYTGKPIIHQDCIRLCESLLSFPSPSAAGQGKGCRVMCAQPRRISAVSIAERVASERGEKIGQDIGYSIRLESKCAQSR